MKAIFFDRDGTLTTSPTPPETKDQLELAPDAITVLQNLKEAGYLLFLVSNQPDIAKGTNSKTNVLMVCNRFAVLTQGLFTERYYCWHTSEDNCVCRKPSPYFLRKAAEGYNLDLAQCWMVGDSDKDIRCGRRAGVRTIRIGSGKKLANYDVSSLTEALKVILDD